MAAALFLLAGAWAWHRAFASPQQRANSWTSPHVLTISDAGDPNTLNPHLGQSAPVANLSEMTMAWLVRWDERNRPYPELATEIPTRENGGVSANGLTITYHLRKGVRWSDGAPFTADDVVFSANVVNNPANNEAARFDQVLRVDEPDKYTVVFSSQKPVLDVRRVVLFELLCQSEHPAEAFACKIPEHQQRSVQRFAGRHRTVPFRALGSRQASRVGGQSALLARPAETRQSNL
ncbi:MAG TPA: ABC transporter substrate-binding protein [Candidatus Baltobacteraceae bacterium]|nr:ABC transporter substrate-binding protein [Candidatus Baltobacteraceae bacterium]